MVERHQWLALVTRLLQVTQIGDLTWTMHFVEHGQQLARGEEVEQYYECEFMGQRFRLFETQYKYFLDETRYEWEKAVKLQFLDAFSRVTFEVPEVEGLYDLLGAVRFQTAGVGKFLNRLTG